MRLTLQTPHSSQLSIPCWKPRTLHSNPNCYQPLLPIATLVWSPRVQPVGTNLQLWLLHHCTAQLVGDHACKCFCHRTVLDRAVVHRCHATHSAMRQRASRHQTRPLVGLQLQPSRAHQQGVGAVVSTTMLQISPCSSWAARLAQIAHYRAAAATAQRAGLSGESATVSCTLPVS